MAYEFMWKFYFRLLNKIMPLNVKSKNEMEIIIGYSKSIEFKITKFSRCFYFDLFLTNYDYI